MEDSLEKMFIVTKNPNSQSKNKGDLLYEEVISKNFQIISELLDKLNKIYNKQQDLELELENSCKRVSKIQSEVEAIHNEHRRENLYVYSKMDNLKVQVETMDNHLRVVFDQFKERSLNSLCVQPSLSPKHNKNRSFSSNRSLKDEPNELGLEAMHLVMPSNLVDQQIQVELAKPDKPFYSKEKDPVDERPRALIDNQSIAPSEINKNAQRFKNFSIRESKPITSTEKRNSIQAVSLLPSDEPPTKKAYQKHPESVGLKIFGRGNPFENRKQPFIFDEQKNVKKGILQKKATLNKKGKQIWQARDSQGLKKRKMSTFCKDQQQQQELSCNNQKSDFTECFMQEITRQLEELKSKSNNYNTIIEESLKSMKFQKMITTVGNDEFVSKIQFREQVRSLQLKLTQLRQDCITNFANRSETRKAISFLQTKMRKALPKTFVEDFEENETDSTCVISRCLMCYRAVEPKKHSTALLHKEASSKSDLKQNSSPIKSNLLKDQKELKKILQGASKSMK